MNNVNIQRKIDALRRLEIDQQGKPEGLLAHNRRLKLQAKLATLPQTANLKTIEGDLLDNLGCGLGATTNGRPCGGCSGLGYRQFYAWTGSFSGTRETIILPTGRVVYLRFGVPSPQKKPLSYSRCRNCEGTGEVVVFNPVILKGSIGAAS